MQSSFSLLILGFAVLAYGSPVPQGAGETANPLAPIASAKAGPGNPFDPNPYDPTQLYKDSQWRTVPKMQPNPHYKDSRIERSTDGFHQVHTTGPISETDKKRWREQWLNSPIAKDTSRTGFHRGNEDTRKTWNSNKKVQANGLEEKMHSNSNSKSTSHVFGMADTKTGEAARAAVKERLPKGKGSDFSSEKTDWMDFHNN